MSHAECIPIVIPPPLQVATPHLGVALISEYLVSQGWAIDVVDANLEIHEALATPRAALWQRHHSHLWSEPWYRVQVRPHVLPGLHSIALRVAADAPPLVAVACNCRDTYGSVTDLARAIRAVSPDTVIVGGGQGLATGDCRRPFGREVFDYIVLGDGEETLDELARRVFDSEPPERLARIPGVLPWRAAGDDPFATFEPRAPRKDLGERPYFPTFASFDMDRYPAVPMLMSRGCVSRCNFCSNPTRTGTYRRYRARDVFDAMLAHVRAGRTSFRFNDLLINGDIPQLEELADLILEAELDIAWSGSMMIRKQMSSALLAKLRRAGMSTLAFGVESFSDEVLRRMGKRYDFEVIARVLRETREAGLATCVHLVLGFPGETEESFRESLERILSLREYITTFGVVGVCALPEGSAVAADREEFGIRPSESSVQWVDETGVDYAQRLNRLQRTVLVLSDAGYDFQPTTVSESAACNLVDPTGNLRPWLRELSTGLRQLGVFSRVMELGGRSLSDDDELADSLLRSNAACTVLALERWDDPEAARLAEAVHRADPSLIVLAAGPDLSAIDALPPHFDGRVIGEPSVSLRDFVQSSLVARRALQSELDGRVELAHDSIVLPALWRRNASLVEWHTSEADGRHRVSLTLQFDRPVRPAHVDIALRSSADDELSTWSGPLPPERVIAGERIQVEADLECVETPRYLTVTLWGHRGGELEELLVDLIELDQPWQRDASPYDRLLPLSRALGRERVLASDMVRRVTAHETPLSPVGRVLADNVSLVEKVVTALVTRSDTVLRGWQLVSFDDPSTVENGFSIELTLRDGEDRLIVQLLPGDSDGPALVEERLVKIRYALRTEPTSRQRDGLAVLGSMVNRYLVNAARQAGASQVGSD